MRRSWLLVPLSDQDLLETAWSQGADVVALDLVELVPEGDKPQARQRAKEAIGAVARGSVEVFVQVDKEQLHADLKACVWRGLAGVIIPRLESARDVQDADELLTQLEAERGILPNAVQIVASVDTARGNLNAMEIARSSSRLWGMTLGRADLVMDLRPEPSGEIYLMPYLTQRIITVANAAGLVPLGAWWRAPARGLMASPDDTCQAALRGRRIGFKGSLCIFPGQVEPLDRGFTPTPEEVAHAQLQLDAYTLGEQAEQGVTYLDGTVLNLPTAKRARRLVAYAHACASRDEEKAQAMAQVTRKIFSRRKSHDQTSRPTLRPYHAGEHREVRE